MEQTLVAEISLILPTRERPALARRMLDSACQTANQPGRLEAMVYVDRDDDSSHAIDHAGLRVVRLVGARAKMGAMTQACYAGSSGRCIMLANDDLVFRTTGWDTEILARLDAHADDVALVWCNDLLRREMLPTHPALSRTAIEVMGGVCPQAYRRDYIDTHIYDIFCMLDRLGHHRFAYLSDVVIEHMHVGAGKGTMDNTSVKLRKSDDEITFIAWAEERRLAAARLARHIENQRGAAVSPVLAKVRRSA
jgi:hypothetical protein